MDGFFISWGGGEGGGRGGGELDGFLFLCTIMGKGWGEVHRFRGEASPAPTHPLDSYVLAHLPSTSPNPSWHSRQTPSVEEQETQSGKMKEHKSGAIISYHWDAQTKLVVCVVLEPVWRRLQLAMNFEL